MKPRVIYPIIVEGKYDKIKLDSIVEANVITTGGFAIFTEDEKIHLIKKLAEKYSYTYVDMYSPLLNLETGEIYEEYTTDGGHLTEKGYEVFTSTLAPFLDEILRNYAGAEN